MSCSRDKCTVWENQEYFSKKIAKCYKRKKHCKRLKVPCIHGCNKNFVEFLEMLTYNPYGIFLQRIMDCFYSEATKFTVSDIHCEAFFSSDYFS